MRPTNTLAWFSRVTAVARKPPLLALQSLLRHVPVLRVEFGQMHFLRFEGVPHVRIALLRGPGAVRRGTAEDIDGLVHCLDKRATYVERFAAGDQCVVAVVGESIVGYEWFSDRLTHMDTRFGYAIEIPRGYIYSYDAYIDPSYRNSGFWVRFKAELATLMQETGKVGVLTYVDAGNAPSLNVHVRCGFSAYKEVLAFRIRGLRLIRERPVHPVRTPSSVGVLRLNASQVDASARVPGVPQPLEPTTLQVAQS